MAKKDCSPLAKKITELAMNLASQSGAKDLDGVLSEMQKHIPEIDRKTLAQFINEATTGGTKDVEDITASLTKIRKEARMDVALRDKIDAWEKAVKGGPVPSSSAKGPSEQPAPIVQLQNILDELKEKVKEQGLTPESEEAKTINRLDKQITNLSNKLAFGELEPEKPAEKIPAQAILDKQYAAAKLRQQIREKMDGLKPPSPLQEVESAVNAGRALMTSWDVSAPGRQGAFLAFGHPINAGKAIGKMFQALVSDQKCWEINTKIINDPAAPLAHKAGLYLAPFEGAEALRAKEEPFMSKMLDKIPVLGMGIKASERSYITVLNQMRMDAFKLMTRGLTMNGEPTMEEAKAIATFINESTGRGGLGRFDSAATGLNTIFFAPRYAVSRFQLLAGHSLWQGDSVSRKIIAKEYARTLIGVGTMYTLAHLAGLKVGTDPTSSDFGKIMVGEKSRVDPLAGLSQILVLLSREASGKNTSSVTGKTRPNDFLDTLGRFVASKGAPLPKEIADLISIHATKEPGKLGKGILGGPMTYGDVAWSNVPMSPRDIFEALKEEGATDGIALGLLSEFGVGVQTYSDRFRIDTTTMSDSDIEAAIKAFTYDRKGKTRKGGKVSGAHEAGDVIPGKEKEMQALTEEQKRRIK
jgi:hypothetical protein